MGRRYPRELTAGGGREETVRREAETRLAGFPSLCRHWKPVGLGRRGSGRVEDQQQRDHRTAFCPTYELDLEAW